MRIHSASMIAAMCLFATGAMPSFVRAGETPAIAPAQPEDEPSTDDQMQRVAEHFGVQIEEKMLDTMLAANAVFDGLPSSKRPCVLRVIAGEMRRAQAASIRSSLPKRSDVAAFERFAATEGGRRLLAVFRSSIEDAMAGRAEPNRFQALEQQATAQERADIEAFMQTPQSLVLRQSPRIGQPVDGMAALQARLARECQVS